MPSERLTGLGLLALGAGIAVSALLGPLVLGVIEFRVSASVESQLIGGEVISLFVAAPLAVVAGVLWLRRHRLAAVLALGPAIYAVYMYVQYILAPEYERYAGNNEYFFPLYLALIILGWATALRAWTALGKANLPPLPAGVRRALASLLIVLSAIFAVAWISSIATVLGGSAGPEYQEHPTLFWLVRLMDLAFIIPASLVTGVGLLRWAPWASRLAYALVGFQTLLVGAVAGMAVVMAWRDDPSADPVFLLVTVGITLALAVVFVLVLHSAVQRARQQIVRPS